MPYLVVEKQIGNLRLIEVICDTPNRRGFRAPRGNEGWDLIFAIAERWESYASVLGHLVELEGKKFRHISGASGVDDELKEGNYQFSQRNWNRTMMFAPICWNNAFRKYYLNKKKGTPRPPEKLLCQYIKLYDAQEVAYRIEQGRGEYRDLSVAAGKKGHYTYYDRPLIYSSRFPGEAVIRSKELVFPEHIVITDSPTSILSAEEVLGEGIAKAIEAQYPGLKTVIKITGETVPFFYKSVYGSKNGKRIAASGEGIFSAVGMKAMEVIVQLQEMGKI